MSRADEGGGVVTSHGELAAFACGLRKYPAGLRGEGGGTGSPVTERWPRPNFALKIHQLADIAQFPF